MILELSVVQLQPFGLLINGTNFSQKQRFSEFLNSLLKLPGF